MPRNILTGYISKKNSLIMIPYKEIYHKYFSGI